MTRRLIALTAGFLAGVTGATLFTTNLAWVVWLVLLAGAIALFVRVKGTEGVRQISILLVVFLLAGAGGLLRTQLAYDMFGSSSLEELVGSEVALQGEVIKEPDRRERTTHLYVQVEADTVLVTTDRYTVVAYGDVIAIDGELEKPGTFETDLGRTFDYEQYLKAKGVEYLISFADVRVVEMGQGNWFLASLLSIKHTFMASLERVMPQPAVGLAEGILLGVQQGLGERLEEDFRRSGIIHIVVLSGYNVMLVVSFTLFLLSFLLPPKGRLLFGLVAITSFALIVGLSATVVRASIMAGLFLIAHSLGKQYDVLRALIFAGLIMVALNPLILFYDIGFQLSFMATLGLILALPFFNTTDQPETIGFSVRSYVVATIATQIAVLPLLLYHIGEISLVAVVVNVLVLPAVPLAMLLSFVTGVVTLLSFPIGLGLAYITAIPLQFIILTAQFFASLPFATLTVPAFAPGWVFVGYAVLFIAYYYFRTPQVQNEFSDWQIVEESESGADRRSAPQRDVATPKAFR